MDSRPQFKTLEEEYSDKWSWYIILRELAKGDLTRFEEMTKLNLILVLNDLSFQKETNNLKQEIARKSR